MALSYRNRFMPGVTAVANEFIDTYMAKASGEYVKVYLYLLRHENGDVTLEDIASALELTEADVRRALNYWTKEGVLEAGEGKAPAARETPASAGMEKKASLTAERRSACSAELLEGLAKDEDFSQLLYIAQKYLNKVFTSRDCEVFGYLYGRLKMSAELLEYLVEYCAQGGHTSIRYIETVALDWHKRGIRMVQEAREYSAGFQKDTFAVMRAFGLGDRRPGDGEKDLIERWFKVYGFTRDMVVEACSRTLAAIHNPSFQYADKILSQWKEAGVTGMEDVRRLDEKRAEKAKNREEKKPARAKSSNRFHNYEQDSYDYDEMVWKMIREQA